MAKDRPFLRMLLAKFGPLLDQLLKRLMDGLLDELATVKVHGAQFSAKNIAMTYTPAQIKAAAKRATKNLKAELKG